MSVLLLFISLTPPLPVQSPEWKRRSEKPQKHIEKAQKSRFLAWPEIIFWQPVWFFSDFFIIVFVVMFVLENCVSAAFLPYYSSSPLVYFSNSATASPEPGMRRDEGRTIKIFLENLKKIQVLTWLQKNSRELNNYFSSTNSKKAAR